MKTWGWDNITFLGPFQKILQLWIVPNQKKAKRFYLKDDCCPNFHIYTPHQKPRESKPTKLCPWVGSGILYMNQIILKTSHFVWSAGLRGKTGIKPLHPGRLTWNLQITHLERKMIFQTSITMFHFNLQGCNHLSFFAVFHEIFIQVEPTFSPFGPDPSPFWEVPGGWQRDAWDVGTLSQIPLGSMYGNVYLPTYDWVLW